MVGVVVERVAITVVAVIDGGSAGAVERRIQTARDAGADEVELLSAEAAASTAPPLVGAADMAWAIIGGAREIRTRQVRTARRVADVLGAILAAREHAVDG
jgi:hypothetical protein